MGLNNVDVSCIGTRFATGPSTCTVSWGYGEMVVKRVGGEELVNGLLYPQQHVPS